MGSDHFPILLRFGKTLFTEGQNRPKCFKYSKANWEQFVDRCNKAIEGVKGEGTIDEWSNSLCEAIMCGACKCVLVKKNPKRRISVPWWNKVCNEAIRARNQAYRSLRKSPMESIAMEYKRLRAKARRVVKGAKRECWRRYCGKLGVEATVAEMWCSVHHMSGILRKNNMPVLDEEGKVFTSDLEKAKLCEAKFKSVHSGVNLGEEGVRKRNETLRRHVYKIEVNENYSDSCNLYFSLEEFRRAIKKGRRTAPDKDGISHEILKKVI